MEPEKLVKLKKELSNYSVPELTDLCLRLAKYKKENKELLQYLIYDAQDPMEYAEKVKLFLLEEFKSIQKHYYYSTKSMRKIIRLMNRYAKYTASKQVETELALWFCSNYLIFADLNTNHKALQGLMRRQLDRITKLIPRLHEDLQFDYQLEFDALLAKADKQVTWLNKADYL